MKIIRSRKHNVTIQSNDKQYTYGDWNVHQHRQLLKLLRHKRIGEAWCLLEKYPLLEK